MGGYLKTEKNIFDEKRKNKEEKSMSKSEQIAMILRKKMEW